MFIYLHEKMNHSVPCKQTFNSRYSALAHTHTHTTKLPVAHSLPTYNPNWSTRSTHNAPSS